MGTTREIITGWQVWLSFPCAGQYIKYFAYAFLFNPHPQLVKIHSCTFKIIQMGKLWLNEVNLYKFTPLTSRKARFEPIQPDARGTEIWEILGTTACKIVPFYLIFQCFPAQSMINYSECLTWFSSWLTRDYSHINQKKPVQGFVLIPKERDGSAWTFCSFKWCHGTAPSLGCEQDGPRGGPSVLGTSTK